MNLYSKIIKQTGFLYFTTILSLIFSPILVIILTRTLTVSEYGVYSIIAVSLTTLVFVLELGIPQYIMTRLTGIEKNEKASRFFSIYFFEGVFVLLMLVLIFIFQDFF